MLHKTMLILLVFNLILRLKKFEDQLKTIEIELNHNLPLCLNPKFCCHRLRATRPTAGNVPTTDSKQPQKIWEEIFWTVSLTPTLCN